jgi:hypothetical protein
MTEVPVEKDNALTRFMRQVADTNAAAGLPAGRSAGGPAGVDPPTRVRSNAMNSPLPVRPLSPEERAELDQKARAIGIMPKDELDELTDPDDEDECVALSEQEKLNPTASAIPTPGSIRNPARATAPSQILNEARGPYVAFTPLKKSQLPDFRNVEGFDLINNTIRVDGMIFPIPLEDVLAMKSYAVQIVLDHVVAQLAKALIEFGVPGVAAAEAADRLRESINDGKETVSEVRAGTTSSGVSPEPDQVEKLGLPVVLSSGDGELPAVGEGIGEATPE